jgi:hypothetical protein
MEIKLTIKIEGLEELTKAVTGVDMSLEELANTIRSKFGTMNNQRAGQIVTTALNDAGAPVNEVLGQQPAAPETGFLGEHEVRIEDEKPAKETKKKPAAEAPKPTAKATKEEIATTLATVAKRDGNNLKVAEFLRNHGATKMSDLDPVKFNYDDLLAQAKAL